MDAVENRMDAVEEGVNCVEEEEVNFCGEGGSLWRRGWMLFRRGGFLWWSVDTVEVQFKPRIPILITLTLSIVFFLWLKHELH